MPLRTILGKRALWASCAAHFCNNYGFYFLITWLPLYLVTERGMSLELMATLTALAYATQTMAAVGGGWLSDRLVARRVARGKGAQVDPGAGEPGQGDRHRRHRARGEARGWSSSGWSSPASPWASPARQNFAVPQIFAGPAAAGRWVGMQNFAANCSGILGPVITGILVDATDSYWSAFAVAGAFTLAAAGIWGAVVPRVEPVAMGPSRMTPRAWRGKCSNVGKGQDAT